MGASKFGIDLEAAPAECGTTGPRVRGFAPLFCVLVDARSQWSWDRCCKTVGNLTVLDGGIGVPGGKRCSLAIVVELVALSHRERAGDCSACVGFEREQTSIALLSNLFLFG